MLQFAGLVRMKLILVTVLQSTFFYPEQPRCFNSDSNLHNNCSYIQLEMYVHSLGEYPLSLHYLMIRMLF